MTRIRLTIAYDGSRFAGWQIQPRDRTVAGELVRALETIHQAPIRLFGSSRTDAGVHAKGQVAHYDVPRPLEPARIRRSLNGLLRGEVVAREVRIASPEFHARFDACWRRYRYRLDRALALEPLERGFRLHVPQELDRDAMEAALPRLLGEQDFNAFRSAHCSSRTTMRRLLEARLETDGPRWDLVFSANAFLQQMVRILVGTLLEIGHGKRSPEDLTEILESRDRRRAGPTAAPHGLCLEHVSYRAFPGDGSSPTGGPVSS